jgi:hypothetical protein
MAWWHAFSSRKTLPTPRPDTTPPPATLTAAAQPVTSPRTDLLRKPDSWQEEAWAYYEDLGPFRYAVEWKSAMLSRVRIYAARLETGEDEPVRADAGTAVDLMTTLGGGVSGQAQLMAELATQLDVPGEGYLIGETVKVGETSVERWSVRSMDEVQARNRQFQVMDESSTSAGAKWRPLAEDSLVNRVYRPSKRYRYRADSPARAARSTMRELELVNRHILAQYLSRLASAGVVIFPDEVTFPVREEFADAADPFMAEWIEIAAEAISKPGTASAVVPIPMRMPGEWIDKVKHVDFTLQIDDKIIEKRDSAIKNLASQLNIPAEVLLGMGDLNHWGAWSVDEAALKTNIAPDAELICQAITEGYLQPRLKASGVEDYANWVVWYDMSELALRPDRSADAFSAYDRLEINGTALRRETGFDEADKPTGDELEEQALKIIIKTLPSGAGSALSQLIGKQITIAPTAPLQPGETVTPAADAAPAPAEQAPPDTQGQPPPGTAADRAAAQARTDRMLRQARSLHAVRFATASGPELLHPASCAEHAYSCPFTHAAAKLATLARPGTSGTYEARLDPFGQLTIGRLAPHWNTSGFLTTRSSNGFAHSGR